MVFANVEVWHSDWSVPVGYLTVTDEEEAAGQIEITGKLRCGTMETVTIWF